MHSVIGEIDISLNDWFMDTYWLHCYVEYADLSVVTTTEALARRLTECWPAICCRHIFKQNFPLADESRVDLRLGPEWIALKKRNENVTYLLQRNFISTSNVLGWGAFSYS